MNIAKILNQDDSDYVFASLQIENHNDGSLSRLRHWFRHCRDNHAKLEGDIFEFGVYKGASLLSMAALLKRLGSTKKVYGFDSFSGFPSYHPMDGIENFRKMEGTTFDRQHVQKTELLKSIKEKLNPNKALTVKNISESGEFDNTSYDLLLKRIELYELDNIEIIIGDFKETVPYFFSTFQGSIFSANIDCDLYIGYNVTLPMSYNKLTSGGGYINLDEYFSLKFPGARIACHEFFLANNITPHKHNTPPSEFERWYLTK